MALLEIFDVNQPCLRARAKRVPRVTGAERELLEDMIETMRAHQGVGLAAPQVGLLERLVVVEVDDELYQLINPEVSESSTETDIREEGCLSLPNYYGPVERAIRVTVRALDPTGKKIKIKAEDWLARVLQHEIDHLDGILFFDPQRMRSLNDLYYRPPRTSEEQAEDERRAAEASATGDQTGSVPGPSVGVETAELADLVRSSQ